MRDKRVSVQVSLLSVAISAALAAPLVMAAEPLELAPTQINVSRLPQTLSSVAGTLYQFDRQQISQQSGVGRSTADVLMQLVPSLAPSSGTTSNYGMTMRGRTVQIMIDGVPLTGSRDGSRQLNSINPAMIERIEVLSGASSVYGAGATGGLINIITRDAGEAALAASSEVGIRVADRPSADSMAYNATQTLSFNQGDFSGFAGLNYSQQGEVQNAHGQRVGPEVAQTDRQDTRSYDFNGRLNWQLAPQQHLSAGIRYYDDQQDSDYGPDYGPNLAALLSTSYIPSGKALKGLKLDDQPRTRHQMFNVNYQNGDFLGHELSSEAYYRNEKGRWFPSVAVIAHSALPGGYTYSAMQSNTDIDVWGARAALHKGFTLAGRELALSYGLDFERERDSQTGQSYNISQFMASNGLIYVPQQRYAMGPDVEINKTGAFVQADYALSDRWQLKAGIRHEQIEDRIDDSIPYSEAIASTGAPGYQAKTLKGGTIKHRENLFNLGAVYSLNDEQQLFGNFSQGFSLPDTQRMLRDVAPSFVINSIEPIKVNSYEFGWRMQGDQLLNAGVTAFYNTSDKVVQFNRDYSVSVADTDERVWGAEANLDYQLLPELQVGGTLAYTRGQYRDAKDDWRELNAYRISPLKSTLYADWSNGQGYGLRWQALIIGGTDRAYDDAQSAAVSSTIRANAAAKIQGYAVMDLIARAPLLSGEVKAGVYNLADRDYKTVYSQQADATYGHISSVAAQGRTFALSYSIDY